MVCTILGQKQIITFIVNEWRATLWKHRQLILLSFPWDLFKIDCYSQNNAAFPGKGNQKEDRANDSIIWQDKICNSRQQGYVVASTVVSQKVHSLNAGQGISVWSLNVASHPCVGFLWVVQPPPTVKREEKKERRNVLWFWSVHRS